MQTHLQPSLFMLVALSPFHLALGTIFGCNPGCHPHRKQPQWHHGNELPLVAGWWNSLQLFHNKILMEEDDGSPSKGWPVFLWRKKTLLGHKPFWKQDQRDTEVIPFKECIRSYPDEFVNVNRLLFSTWHLAIHDKDQWKNVKETFLIGQTATFKSGFLGQSFVWSTRPPGWLGNGTEKTGLNCWEWRWQLLSCRPLQAEWEQRERWICGGRENASS